MRIISALVAGLTIGTLLAGGVVRAADDDLKIAPKKPVAAKSNAATAKTAVAASAKSDAPAPAAKSTATPAGGREPQVIRVKLTEGGDLRQAWSDYFSKHPEVEPADVAQTADALMHGKKATELVAMLEEAIVHNQAQPWMYEALELAMQAADSPKEELERALMSAVDFSSSIQDVIYVAQYMATHGLEERAMKVFHQVAILDPSLTEPYVLGLPLANRMESTPDVEWACLGILSQAWPKSEHQIEESAYHTALATIEQLKKEGKTDEAERFRGELDAALTRDCKVVVSWTGDADVDILVQEPSGTICYRRNPRTTSGGVLLEDIASGGRKPTAEGYSETYICPRAFSGQYKILVRRMWGKVTTGKVNIDIYTHYNTKQVQHGRFKLAVGDQDSVGEFELADGRRTESLDERRLATAVESQLALNQAVVNQQLNYGSDSSSATASLKQSQEALAALPAVRGAAGYQPVIVNLPSGAMLMGMGVVSADRRYVRITPTPMFSSIGQVTTFNLQRGNLGSSNSSSTTGGGTGGGFAS